MLQATFGKPALLHINLALGIELLGSSGAITKFFVMGQIKSLLPDKDRDLIRLHMDLAGVIDFEQKTAAFDAALFDSRLARTFTISGQMALRASWGNSPNFALAVGGFHPDFAAPARLSQAHARLHQPVRRRKPACSLRGVFRADLEHYAVRGKGGSLRQSFEVLGAGIRVVRVLVQP